MRAAKSPRLSTISSPSTSFQSWRPVFILPNKSEERPDSSRYAALPLQDDDCRELLYPTTSRSRNPSECWTRFTRRAWNRFANYEFLIDPRKKLWRTWDVLIFTLTLICMVSVPFEVAFLNLNLEKMGWRWNLFQRFIDSLFWFDMLLQFFTMYYCHSSMRWIRLPRAITLRYVKWLLAPDVLANFPYDMLGPYLDTLWSNHFLQLISLLRMLRFTRLWRLHLIFLKFRVHFGFTSAQTKIPGFVMLCVFVTHWLACSWAIIGRLGVWNGQPAWIESLYDTTGEKLSVDTPFRFYTRSLYWAVGTVTSNGYGDITPQNGIEYAACVVFMALAGFVWAYSIGTICGIVGTLDIREGEFELLMDNVEDMLNEIELHPKAKGQLRQFYERHRYCVHMRRDLNLLRMMSPKLHADISREQLTPWLDGISYMKDIAKSSQVIMYIRSEVHNQLFSKWDVIDLHQTLCLLHRGLAVKWPEILSRGSVWGEGDVLLSNLDLLDLEMPVALTYCEVFHLPQRALHVLQERHEQTRLRLRRASARYALHRHMIRMGRQLMEIRDSKKSVKSKREVLGLPIDTQHNASAQVKLQHLQDKYVTLHKRVDNAISRLELSLEQMRDLSNKSPPRIVHTRKLSRLRNRLKGWSRFYHHTPKSPHTSRSSFGSFSSSGQGSDQTNQESDSESQLSEEDLVAADETEGLEPITEPMTNGSTDLRYGVSFASSGAPSVPSEAGVDNVNNTPIKRSVQAISLPQRGGQLSRSGSQSTAGESLLSLSSVLPARSRRQRFDASVSFHDESRPVGEVKSFSTGGLSTSESATLSTTTRSQLLRGDFSSHGSATGTPRSQLIRNFSSRHCQM